MRITQKRLTILAMALALAWSLIQAMASPNKGASEGDLSLAALESRE